MNTSTKTAAARKLAPAAPSEIPATLLTELREHLTTRRVAAGIALFRRHQHLLDSLQPTQERAACLVGALAEWVDVGFDGPARVRELLSRFPQPVRSALPLGDYLHLRLAEGMAAMHEELADDAILHFDFVISLCEELRDQETLAIANFWKGGCLRKKGEYDEALIYTSIGRDLALALGHPAMSAVMRVLESWLVFQKGRGREATSMLRQAYAVLRDTDDYVTLGNIHSSHGRIARREGRYQDALEHFNSAIEEYKKRDRHHRNLARSLTNMALVKRFIALQLRNRVDADVRRRRKSAQTDATIATPTARYRERMTELRQQAFAHLQEAAAIYAQHPTHHGAGSVRLSGGYLHLDNGDYDQAEAEADAAWSLAEEKRDMILMARVRLLQCMIENAKVDDEIGDGADPGKHARRALELSREAIDLASHTQNRRLLANAHLWQGLSHCNAFLDDCESARHCYEQALALLRGEQAGNMSEDLLALKAKIFRTGSIDATLRAWSQGSVGDKTFRQVTDEFAEIVIPKVWEREGKKISRVAARLSISPKKVRRVLTRAGRRTGAK